MLFPLLLVPLVASVLVYRHLRSRGSEAAIWRSAARTGVTLGALRAALVCAGWWAVERTAGPLQIPGHALALLAWPEATLLPRSPRVLPPEGYAILGALVFCGAVAWVLVLASAAVLRRRG